MQLKLRQIDWASVLSQHEHWLRTVVAARLGESQGADEVMQEVCLAAIRQNSPLQDLDKAAPWLYRLAVRHALLYRRKLGRSRKLAERYAEKFQPSESDERADPLAWLISSERRQLVRSAIRKLPPRDREILLLKYVEGWSYREMAKHLGTTFSTVESRLFRARNRMRRELSAMNVVEVE